MPVTMAGSENAKRNETSAVPTTERIGIASAASSGSADALMIPAAPPSADHQRGQRRSAEHPEGDVEHAEDADVGVHLAPPHRSAFVVV